MCHLPRLEQIGPHDRSEPLPGWRVLSIPWPRGLTSRSSPHPFSLAPFTSPHPTLVKATAYFKWGSLYDFLWDHIGQLDSLSCIIPTLCEFKNFHLKFTYFYFIIYYYYYYFIYLTVLEVWIRLWTEFCRPYSHQGMFHHIDLRMWFWPQNSPICQSFLMPQTALYKPWY